MDIACHRFRTTHGAGICKTTRLQIQPTHHQTTAIARQSVSNLGDQYYQIATQKLSHNSSCVVLVVRVKLVGEGSSPYALSALARAQGVPALDHEVFDISMKLRSIVVPAVVFISVSFGRWAEEQFEACSI